MNKVLLAIGLFLAISGFTARQYARRQENEAKYDLYQRRQWCHERVPAEPAARWSKRSSSQ